MTPQSPLSSLQKYLIATGLEHIVYNTDDVLLNTIVEDAFEQLCYNLSEEDIERLYIYDIPQLSSDGSCSILEKKSDIPFNLATTFDLSFNIPILKGHPHTLRLWRLRQIIKQLYSLSKVNWLGAYRKMQNGNGETVLVKESYLGALSRPEFPLTQRFAKHSTNSTVGLTGKATLIQDVKKYTGSYYICDSRVKSEFCVPIIDSNNLIIGIIDAESFKENYFSSNIILQIVKVAMDLWRKGLGI